MNSRRKCRKLR